jgi:hypothetical protein
LIGGGGNRFGGIMHPFGGNQAVGVTPAYAVRYGLMRCHFTYEVHNGLNK